jgi:hypothetical protein
VPARLTSGRYSRHSGKQMLALRLTYFDQKRRSEAFNRPAKRTPSASLSACAFAGFLFFQNGSCGMLR